jgi:hypothetical protein
MKNMLFILLISSVVLGASFVFTKKDGGSVIGTISPANVATSAWMASGTDTFKTVIKDNGFAFYNVKRGTYILLIEAIPTYKNVTKSNIMVSDGTTTNIGETVISQ